MGDSWLREHFLVFRDGRIWHLYPAVTRDASDKALNHAVLIRHCGGIDIGIERRLNCFEGRLRMIELKLLIKTCLDSCYTNDASIGTSNRQYIRANGQSTVYAVVTCVGMSQKRTQRKKSRQPDAVSSQLQPQRQVSLQTAFDQRVDKPYLCYPASLAMVRIKSLSSLLSC